MYWSSLVIPLIFVFLVPICKILFGPLPIDQISLVILVQIVQAGPLIIFGRLVQLVADRDGGHSFKPGQVVDAEPAALDFVVPLGREFGHEAQDIVRGLHDAAVRVLQQLHDVFHNLRLGQDDRAGSFVQYQALDCE